MTLFLIQISKLSFDSQLYPLKNERFSNTLRLKKKTNNKNKKMSTNYIKHKNQTFDYKKTKIVK